MQMQLDERHGQVDGEKGGCRLLLTGLPSDSHTWNLVFLELWLGERGHAVDNLGACAPIDGIVRACLAARPDVLMVSTLNGHGHAEGLELLEALGRQPALGGMKVVIGGKLATSPELEQRAARQLLAAGFDGVFVGSTSLADFEAFLAEAGLSSEARPWLANVA